jgi:hypothetical protein
MSRALAPVVAQASSPPTDTAEAAKPTPAETQSGEPAAPNAVTAPDEAEGKPAEPSVAEAADKKPEESAVSGALNSEPPESTDAKAADDKPDGSSAEAAAGPEPPEFTDAEATDNKPSTDDWPEPVTSSTIPIGTAASPGEVAASEEAADASEPAATPDTEDQPVPDAGEPEIAADDASARASAEQMPAPEGQQGDVGETAAQAAELGESEPAFEAEASPEKLPDSEPVAEQPAMPASPMVAAGLAVLSRTSDEPTTDRESGREPAGADLQMTHARNRVYDHLVEGEDDVIGLITYSLYKQDKRDWLVNWMAHHGTEPTADQVEAFVNAQMTTAQRERYRNAARQVLDAYASVAVDLEKPVIVREAIAGRVEDAARKAERSTGFWRQFGIALLGGVITAAIVIGVVAILIAAGVDLAGYLGFETNGG